MDAFLNCWSPTSCDASHIDRDFWIFWLSLWGGYLIFLAIISVIVVWQGRGWRKWYRSQMRRLTDQNTN